MAQVPYNPVPAIAPTEAGLPTPRVNAPLEAFGGATGQALSTLGKTSEHAGDELFARAVAMQQLNNETEAREADTQYMMSAGELHANYNALQGKDRVEAFPKYMKDLQESRTKLRDSLSNDMARKMYDASSLSTMGRSIFNGAGVAAAAQKEYTIGTVKSQLAIDLKTIEDDPSEGNFQEKLHRIDNSVRSLAAQQGLGENSPQEQELRLKATSQAWASRIIGLSRTAPFEAANMLDKNKTQMVEADFLRVDNAVRTQARAVGATNIADQVYEEGRETDKRPAKALSVMEVEAAAKARAMSPDDSILAKHAVDALRHKFYYNKQADKETQYTNQQIVLKAIQSGVQSDQELLADPKVAAAYNALPSSDPMKKKPLNYQINTYNTERDKQEMDAAYTHLLGLSRNDQAGFLNTNLNEVKLTPGNRNSLLAIRDKMIQKPNEDPRVWGAMRVLRGAHAAELNALKLYRRDPNSPDDYDKFTGVLEIALDEYLAKNKKPADAKTISEEIFPELIQNIQEPGWLYGTDETPFYKLSDYTPEYKQFHKAYQAQMTVDGRAAPSDEATYRAYMRFKFQQLHGKSDGKP